MLRSELPTLTLVLAAAVTLSCGPPAERYELEGSVISVDVDAGRVTVAHKDIPGFMGAMTMPFSVVDRKLLPSIQEGDTLRATLVVDGNSHWLEDLVVSRAVASGSLAEQMAAGPALGSMVPDIELVNHDSEPIRMSDYQGRAVVLTFIYTRCPLVDFCPLMNKHFEAIEQSLQSDPELYRRTHLLSISFDPEFDTPELLRTFALQRHGITEETLNHWEFATGTHENLRILGYELGLTYQAAGEDEIVHNLRTALIAPDGTLAKVYTGNEWTPEEVVADMQELVGP
jgi:protein SCO1/2